MKNVSLNEETSKPKKIQTHQNKIERLFSFTAQLLISNISHSYSMRKCFQDFKIFCLRKIKIIMMSYIM